MTRRTWIVAGGVAALFGLAVLAPDPRPATPAVAPAAGPATVPATGPAIGSPTEAATGNPSPAPATQPGSRPPATRPPAAGKPAIRNPAPRPATAVAAAWTAAACAYTWQTPWQTHAATQAALSTAALRARLTSRSAAVDWQAEVVAPRSVAACRVTASVLMPEAPNTATVAYVRVAAVQTVTRRGIRTGPAVGYWPLRLARTAAGWRVEAISGGG